jgi:hypothetical protein
MKDNKKPRKYLAMVPVEDGWCDWSFPIPGYRMMCCDCGLVHEMEFDVVHQLGPPNKDGVWPSQPPKEENLRVMFRARRDEKETARARKKRVKP